MADLSSRRLFSPSRLLVLFFCALSLVLFLDFLSTEDKSESVFYPLNFFEIYSFLPEKVEWRGWGALAKINELQDEGLGIERNTQTSSSRQIKKKHFSERSDPLLVEQAAAILGPLSRGLLLDGSIVEQVDARRGMVCLRVQSPGFETCEGEELIYPPEIDGKVVIEPVSCTMPWQERVCFFKTLCYHPASSKRNPWTVPTHPNSSEEAERGHTEEEESSRMDLGSFLMTRRSYPWEGPGDIKGGHPLQEENHEIHVMTSSDFAGGGIGHFIGDVLFPTFGLLDIFGFSSLPVRLLHWGGDLPSSCGSLPLPAAQDFLQKPSYSNVCCAWPRKAKAVGCSRPRDKVIKECERSYSDLLPAFLKEGKVRVLGEGSHSGAECFQNVVTGGFSLLSDHCIDKTEHGRWGSAHWCNQGPVRRKRWWAFREYVLSHHSIVTPKSSSSFLWGAFSDKRMTCWYGPGKLQGEGGRLQKKLNLNKLSMKVETHFLPKLPVSKQMEIIANSGGMISNCGSAVFWGLFLPSSALHLILCDSCAMDWHFVRYWRFQVPLFLLHGDGRKRQMCAGNPKCQKKEPFNWTTRIDHLTSLVASLISEHHSGRLTAERDGEEDELPMDGSHPMIRWVAGEPSQFCPKR